MDWKGKLFAALFGLVTFVLVVSCLGIGAYWLWVNGPTPVSVPQTAASAPPIEWGWPAPWAQPPEAPADQALPEVTGESQTECNRLMTTEQVQKLTGVMVQRIGTECDSYVWRGSDQATEVATCPVGFICTWDVKDDVVIVHEGVGQQATIYAGTFRYVASFPSGDAVHDICELYAKELDFANDEGYEIRFQPVPGGQQCS